MHGTIASQTDIPGTDKAKGWDKTHDSNPTTYRGTWRRSVEEEKKDHTCSGFFLLRHLEVVNGSPEAYVILGTESHRRSRACRGAPDAYDDNHELGVDVRGVVRKAEIAKEESVSVVFSGDYRPGARVVEIHSMGRKRDASNT